MDRHLFVTQGTPARAYPTHLLRSPAALKVFSNELAWKVYKAFVSPQVPIDVAKAMGIHEQKIYYYVNRFKRAGLLRKTGEEQRHGTIASSYQATDGCFTFQAHEDDGQDISAPLANKHLEPFIRNGRLQARIVVGSPDPHGPWQARASDACCAIDFALFLGGYTTTITVPNYKLDTEIREKDLQGNLIMIGGPSPGSVSRARARLSLR